MPFLSGPEIKTAYLERSLDISRSRSATERLYMVTDLSDLDKNDYELVMSQITDILESLRQGERKESQKPIMYSDLSIEAKVLLAKHDLLNIDQLIEVESKKSDRTIDATHLQSFITNLNRIVNEKFIGQGRMGTFEEVRGVGAGSVMAASTGERNSRGKRKNPATKVEDIL